MASKQKYGEVRIVTKDGEVKIKLEIDININNGDFAVRALAADQSENEQKEENVWTIPDFENTKVNFGKNLGETK